MCNSLCRSLPEKRRLGNTRRVREGSYGNPPVVRCWCHWALKPRRAFLIKGTEMIHQNWADFAMILPCSVIVCVGVVFCPGNPLAVELLSGEGKKSRFLEGELCGNWFGSKGNHDSIWEGSTNRDDTGWHCSCEMYLDYLIRQTWHGQPVDCNPKESHLVIRFILFLSQSATWINMRDQYRPLNTSVCRLHDTSASGFKCTRFCELFGVHAAGVAQWTCVFFDTTVLRTSSNVHWSIVSRWQGEGKEGDS